MPSPALNSEQCPTSLPDLPMSNARTLVAHEIYMTEHTYVKGLEIAAQVCCAVRHGNYTAVRLQACLQVFMPPLSTVLEASEVAAIFANLERLGEW